MSFLSHAGTFLVMKQTGGSWCGMQSHSRIWRPDGLAKPILTQISLFSEVTLNMRAGNRRSNGYFMYFSPGFRSAACIPSIAPPIRPTPSSTPSPNSSWIWRQVPPASRSQTCLKKSPKAQDSHNLLLSRDPDFSLTRCGSGWQGGEVALQLL